MNMNKDNRWYGMGVYQVLGHSIHDRKGADGSGLFIVNSHSSSPWFALEHAEKVIQREKMQATLDKHEIVSLYVKGYMDTVWCAYVPPPPEDES